MIGIRLVIGAIFVANIVVLAAILYVVAHFLAKVW